MYICHGNTRIYTNLFLIILIISILNNYCCYNNIHRCYELTIPTGYFIASMIYVNIALYVLDWNLNSLAAVIIITIAI